MVLEMLRKRKKKGKHGSVNVLIFVFLCLCVCACSHGHIWMWSSCSRYLCNMCTLTRCSMWKEEIQATPPVPCKF